MALSSTAAAVNLQDTNGAVVAQSAGQVSLVTPGAFANFSLQTTQGVASWEMTFTCPNFPSLHGKTFRWLAGQGNQLQIPIPDAFVGNYTSAVTDGQQSIVSTPGALITKGYAAYSRQHSARLCAIAALAAYTNVSGTITMNANGALANIDGVAPAVGDFVLLPPGIAAATADVGIYQVASLGGASSKASLVLSPDWGLGSVVQNGTEIRIEQGTVMGGTTWAVTNAGLSTVGTTVFTMYPREVIQSVTLVAGTVTITNVPVASATQTVATCERITANTCTSTVAYATVGGKTAGALGTASITFDACVAAGTINAADVSTLAVSIRNMV